MADRISALKEQALILRQMADRRWDHGKKAAAADLHAQAAKIDEEVATLEKEARDEQGRNEH